MHTTYPAIFFRDFCSDGSEGVNVEFPDLPGCLTYGEDEEEAIAKAREVLSLHVNGYAEVLKQPLPVPSDPASIGVPHGATVRLVTAEPLSYESTKDGATTVTYPAIFQPVPNGDYFVEFPDLPGCFTQGRGLAAARILAAGALGGWMDVSIMRGDPINPPSDPATLHADSGFVELVTAVVLETLGDNRTAT